MGISNGRRGGRARVGAFLLAAAAHLAHAGLPPAITLTCPTNRTVPCDSAWLFDPPAVTSTCPIANGYVDQQPYVTTTSGVCPRVVTRTWTFTDYCGNTATCSQAVTLLDSNAPAALCAGVNLVPNSSFENRASCPDYFSQVPLAGPWYNPTVATPDYFNACGSGPYIRVPTNFAGVQAPLSGQAYAGFIVFAQTGNDADNSYREYLQAPLLAPLFSGQAYRVSFRVSLAESSPWAIADIGAHFSAAPVLLPAAQTTLQVSPQVANPPTNLLASTSAWMLVQGTFTATGGEAFITLGNFLSDAATAAAAGPGTNDYTYYYVDDVEVVALCDSTATGKVVLCGTPWTFDPPRGVDACSGSNVAVAVAATITNGGCPRVITRTWTLTDLCGNTGAWSQAATVVDTTPPVITCACLEDSAIPQLNTNSCAAVVPNLCIYSQCYFDACGTVTATQAPAAGTVLGPGSHAVTVTVTDCSGNASTCAVPFNVAAGAPVLACPGNLVVQTCSNSVAVHFLVGGTGYVGSIGCAPASGSVFTQGTTLVTCTATSACGGVAQCTFPVTVRLPRFRWGCWATQVGIGVPFGPVGGATAAARGTGPGYPGLVVYPDAANPTNSGVELHTGPAEALTFTTVLDFTAPVGAGIDLVLPPDPLNVHQVPLLSFRMRGPQGYGVATRKKAADDPAGLFRAIAVNTNGDLLSSFAFTRDEALTNDTLVIGAQPGVSNCHVTVELNLASGAIRLELAGPVVPSAGRKGWDGCIYGPDRPVKKATARLIVTPPVSPGQTPITNIYLFARGLPELVIEEPQLTRARRRWSDGHVTLMKAYDDGSAERGIEFTAGGPGGGVAVDLGFASNVQFQVRPLHGSEVAAPELELRLTGWPPGTTTNRPPAPTNYLGLAAGGGLGVACSADFTSWGVTTVTMRLLSGGLPVLETLHMPALRGVPLAALSAFPETLGSPAVGVLRLASTNEFLLAGPDCGGLPCSGDELLIIAELPPGAAPPLAYTGLEIGIAEDMDLQVYGFAAAPAGTNNPVAVARVAGGVQVSWAGDGFRLQGAESPAGPWHDLGVTSPATVAEGSPLRVFRLVID